MPIDHVSALVLEDNAHMRSLLRVILSSFGIRNIEEASDCQQALSVMGARHIDIAFVDLKLNGPDGLEFCRRMRQSPETAHRYLPIIMVTAYSERARVLDAINAGVDEFLVKPVRAIDVANRVNAVIERRRRFVQSPSYFGPDRRRRQDPRYKGAMRRITDPGVSRV